MIYFDLFIEIGTGTNQAKCPLGTFSNRTGNTLAENCTACTPGSYCGTEGLTEPTDLCDEGMSESRKT